MGIKFFIVSLLITALACNSEKEVAKPKSAAEFSPILDEKKAIVQLETYKGKNIDLISTAFIKAGFTEDQIKIFKSLDLGTRDEKSLQLSADTATTQIDVCAVSAKVMGKIIEITKTDESFKKEDSGKIEDAFEKAFYLLGTNKKNLYPPECEVKFVHLSDFVSSFLKNISDVAVKNQLPDDTKFSLQTTAIVQMLLGKKEAENLSVETTEKEAKSLTDVYFATVDTSVTKEAAETALIKIIDNVKTNPKDFSVSISFTESIFSHIKEKTTLPKEEQTKIVSDFVTESQKVAAQLPNDKLQKDFLTKTMETSLKAKSNIIQNKESACTTVVQNDAIVFTPTQTEATLSAAKKVDPSGSCSKAILDVVATRFADDKDKTSEVYEVIKKITPNLSNTFVATIVEKGGESPDPNITKTGQQTISTTDTPNSDDSDKEVDSSDSKETLSEADEKIEQENNIEITDETEKIPSDILPQEESSELAENTSKPPIETTPTQPQQPSTTIKLPTAIALDESFFSRSLSLDPSQTSTTRAHILHGFTSVEGVVKDKSKRSFILDSHF